MLRDFDYKLFGVIPLDVIYTVVDVGDGSKEIDELIIQYNGEDIDLPSNIIDDIIVSIII